MAVRTYTAYGKVRTSSGALPTDRTFTGQKSDGTGLLYYNARYYDPSLGTFLSPDTLVPDASAVVDYNRFLYARGNPVKYADPSGHCSTTKNGEPDVENDGGCWQMAYSIAGLGNTEQGFHDDWGDKTTPEWWLNNIANQSFATVEYLTPFYERYQREFEGRVGLDRPVSLAPPPRHPIEPMTEAAADVLSGRCELVDCTGLVIDTVGFVGTVAAVSAAPLCGPAAPGCALVGKAGYGVGFVATMYGAGRTLKRAKAGQASGEDVIVTSVTTAASFTPAAPVSGFGQVLWDIFGSPFSGKRN